jgi:manganese efflux pump family protein
MVCGPVIIIGRVTFLMSFCGAILGYKVDHLFEREVSFIGGLIMICIESSLLMFNH